ncbi:putative tudor and KH domain-containing protein isoform 3 [Scophthalmus maximus]|uniref:Putative tudor and KH domain-containing protein isoform 2 n=1 Tax=Scophthalmus maximus TaxID=52904 RepID=A0A2U9CKZ0_SCOMX|nr:putative tudor and KH domain-containing protein isoform 2 [Scophthalmus maximus]AWP17199.1 putative tudor and KH domain-containing protein isoform 3 [Scophthalmus maximus]
MPIHTPYQLVARENVRLRSLRLVAGVVAAQRGPDLTGSRNLAASGVIRFSRQIRRSFTNTLVAICTSHRVASHSDCGEYDVLTLDVLKKQSLDWRRIESHCHDSFEMDVGVSRSHVFLNCSPRALFSQWSVLLGAQRVMDAVKEAQKSSLSSGKMVALAAGLSVGATVGYIVYRHMSSTNHSKGPNVESSKMTLPVDVYRNMSRYQAKFLDVVTQKSGAHVRVLSDSGEVCFLLQGSKEQILLAHCVLENLVTDCEPVTVALEVPQTAFGRIIGRGGESLKLITRTTGAKVACSKERTHGPSAKGDITITGTKEEVKQAKELILEKVREDTMVRTKISQSSALRQKRGNAVINQRVDSTETEAPAGLNNNGLYSQTEKNGLIHACGTAGEPENNLDKMEELKFSSTDNNKEEDEEESLSTDSLSEVSKFEIPSPDLSFQPDEHLEVYVSASENPNHFWIQILGVRSLQLDKLTEEMTRFYNSGNPTEQRVETIVVGDIVAAPYRDHGTWNRARVLGAVSSGLVDLYYVDFGDNWELPRDSLRHMRSVGSGVLQCSCRVLIIVRGIREKLQS